jgi:hypothetical protein
MIRDGRMPSPEEAKRLSDQVATSPTTIPAIMAHATFALGVSDARHGRPYHPDFDLWSGKDQWAYERGRLWAVLAPRDMPLKIHGRLNGAAIAFYEQCRKEIL